MCVLQIAAGKLFTRPVNRVNLLRGMLYTNASFGQIEAIESAAGKLLPSSSHKIYPRVLVYEMLERIEAEGVESGVVLSWSVEPYLNDFAVIASFALNCVCTPDIDLARRLTSGKKGLVTHAAPQDLIRRFFDADIFCQSDELAFLQDFTSRLIGLPRRTFLGVMRAMRTYINAMHRVADEFELAYTLLVASVESLAQDFDEHKGDWESFDERKRRAVDEALKGADEAVAQKVRDALLKAEHTALARRFREFVVAHTPPSYFRDVSLSANESLARTDLVTVLAMAYQSRSKYVHQLQRLPDVVVLGHGYGETVLNERVPHLTLQGLSRLMRSVIIEFVMRQPLVAHEAYNYRMERSGVIRLRMAPQYWVGNVDGDLRNAGRDKLEGFLQQLASSLMKEQGAVVTDLRPVLSAASEFMANIKIAKRLPYLALHNIFNAVVPRADWAPMTVAVEELTRKDFVKPSSEALIAHAITGQVIDWPLAVHREALESYFKKRGNSSGLLFPKLFEAAVTLDLAERYRQAGDMDSCRLMVALAVECHPGHQRLLNLETELDPDVPIQGSEILLPPLPSDAVAEELIDDPELGAN